MEMILSFFAILLHKIASNCKENPQSNYKIKKGYFYYLDQKKVLMLCTELVPLQTKYH